MSYWGSHHSREDPRGVFQSEGQDYVHISQALAREAQQSPGLRVNQHVKVGVLEVDRNCPIVLAQVRMDKIIQLRVSILKC